MDTELAGLLKIDLFIIKNVEKSEKAEVGAHGAGIEETAKRSQSEAKERRFKEGFQQDVVRFSASAAFLTKKERQ